MNFLKKLSILSLKIALLYAVIAFSFGLVKYQNDQEMVKLYADTAKSVVEVYNNIDMQHSGVGSGVFISARFVLTNNHVVEENGDNNVIIKTLDKIYLGTVVYRNAGMDAAVIEVEAPIGTPVKIGNSSSLIIGEKVFSIGSSMGLFNTLGVGYVTAVERYIPLAPYIHIIQISTGIISGNSGGGVFSTKGELIGISFAGIHGSDALGFMIPINYLKFITDKYSY